MGFKIEAFQNRYLAPGQTRVDAILTLTADAPAGRYAQSGQLVVGFILDKSASMEGERMGAVLRAASLALSLLEEHTWFFVVAFDGQAYPIATEALATEENKRHAVRALHALSASGGTAMSTGLRVARSMFERIPNAIHQAIFLTDGKNESESNTSVPHELARCEGVFACDCWGVGTDWRVGEVQEISRVLLGKASLIPEPSGVEAAFRAAIEKASSKALKDVRLRLWTPQGAQLIFTKQVNPTIEDMTPRAKVISAQVREYMTGAWAGGESRDFHVAIEVKPGRIQDEMLAARPSVAYFEFVSEPPAPPAPPAPPMPITAGWVEREDKPAEGRLFASWTDNDTLSSRIEHHVAHYTGQGELADAIHNGLALREQGNEAAATQLLGKAIQLAHASQNTEMTQRLSRVVEVIDAFTGTVRLKKDIQKAATMDLQLESRTTKRVSKTTAVKSSSEPGASGG